jgi:hypothetical protein
MNWDERLLRLLIVLGERGLESTPPPVDTPHRWKCPGCGVWVLHPQEHECLREEV